MENNNYILYCNTHDRESYLWIRDPILLASCIMILVVGWIFISHPMFKNHHPYPLVGWTCIIEAAMFFQGLYLDFLCYNNI